MALTQRSILVPKFFFFYAIVLIIRAIGKTTGNRVFKVSQFWSKKF